MQLIAKIYYFVIDYFFGFRDRLLFSIRHHAELYIGWATTLLGLALTKAPNDGTEVLGFAIAVFGGLSTLFFTVKAVGARIRAYVKDIPVFPPAGFQAAAKRRGYQVLKLPSGLVLSSPAIDEALWRSSTAVAADRKRYELPGAVSKYFGVVFHATNLSAHTTNDKKIKLASDINLGALGAHTVPLRVRLTDYYSGVATNEAAKFAVHVADGTAVIVGSDYLFEDGELLGLDESKASNHIGISSVCLTRDLRLVYQLQGRNFVEPNKYAPAGSGSLDWADLRRFEQRYGRTPTFEELVCFGMEREQSEEVGAVTGPGSARTFLTGYARYVHRAGKPEFFGLSVVNQTFAELKACNRDFRRVRSIHGIDLDSYDKGHFLKRVGSAYNSWASHKDTGTSFYMTLRCALARVEHEPQDFLRDAMRSVGVP